MIEALKRAKKQIIDDIVLFLISTSLLIAIVMLIEFSLGHNDMWPGVLITWIITLAVYGLYSVVMGLLAAPTFGEYRRLRQIGISQGMAFQKAYEDYNLKQRISLPRSWLRGYIKARLSRGQTNEL